MEELKSAVEQSMEWSDEEFKEKMPSLMAKIRGKVGELIDAMPDLPQKLTKRLEESDAKKNAIEAPEASEAFTELLWAVISALVEKKAELKKVVEAAGNIKINYEATDSPMKGHYELKDGKITGGPGLSETQDLKVTGPSDVLIKLTTGTIDSTSGFMQGLYKLEGNLATGMRLAPVTKKIAETLKGQ
ncbi:MAG: SCP2 sterol-binding domain-containing protein [Candidatus Jordarchaeum sp.]|uniref:SCP2 sterol-binding domain-containing protein n=1 Tax=Candidatus Jordarchaeum sp. TaxID=2823881 RepID=UPI0040499441